ncbi:MAG: cyclic nucleotide-binding domain-containing protein [Chitinophagaceae bacterium]|nr:MAG: cyclic nucleotide-binding domain-containing protein [Chitinophagaceae bacterium]
MIMLTSVKILPKFMELGADDYLTKPFDDLELLKAIEIRLKKAELVQAQYGNDAAGAGAFLKDLSDKGIMQLDPVQYESEPFHKKAIIYAESRRPKYLYYIKSGKVKAFRVHENGKEYITNLYQPGDYMGHIPLIEGTNYEESAMVLEDAEIVMIPKDDFLNAIYNDLGIAAKFIALISKDVKEKESRLLNLAYDSLRKRVAKGLVDIHTRFAGNDKSLSISREDIAQYVGTATESLIRTLSDFKSEKLIEIKDGRIIITDIRKLSSLAY